MAVVEITDILKEKFRPYGLDIIQPLAVGWYNSSLPDDIAAHRIPTLPRGENGSQGEGGEGSSLVMLIGNTGAIWKPFVSSLRKSICGKCARLNSSSSYPSSCTCELPSHPFESYVEQSVESVLSSLKNSSLSSITSSSNSSANPNFTASLSPRVYWCHKLVPLEGGEGYLSAQRMAVSSGLAFLDEVILLLLYDLHYQY